MSRSLPSAGATRTLPDYADARAAADGPGTRPAVPGAPDEADLRAAGLRDPRAPIIDQDGPFTEGRIGLGPPRYVGYGAGYRGHRLPDSTREWNNYRYFDGRPSQYGYGEDDYAPRDDQGDAYRLGFNRGYDRGRFDQHNDRNESLLAQAYSSLDNGLIAFRDGRYREAADAFRLACDTNQADVSAKIYAGHALFATGRYRDAVKFLRSAFELQPRIAYLNYDMRKDYRRSGDFDRQMTALEEALRLSPNDEDRLFMKAYLFYYGGNREKAFYVFERLVRINPRDKLAARLMDNCQPPDVAISAPPRAPRRGEKAR